MQTVLDQQMSRWQPVPAELFERIAPTRVESINLRGVYRFPIDITPDSCCGHRRHPKQGLRAEIRLALPPNAHDRRKVGNGFAINDLSLDARAKPGFANRRKLHQNQSHPWLHNFNRLRVRFERLATIHEAFLKNGVLHYFLAPPQEVILLELLRATKTGRVPTGNIGKD